VGKSKDQADKKLVATKSVKKPARRRSKHGINKESAPKPDQAQQIEAFVKMEVDEPTLKKRSTSFGSSSPRSRLSASIRSSFKEVDRAFNLSDELMNVCIECMLYLLLLVVIVKSCSEQTSASVGMWHGRC
jgi:hypothetical protein